MTELVDEALTRPSGEFPGGEPPAAGVNLSPVQKTSLNAAELTRQGASKQSAPSPKSAPRPTEPSPYGPEEKWTTVVVQSLPDGSLQYQTIQNETRFECTLQSSQRRLIDDLAHTCVNIPTFDPKLANALYELLLPNELKSRLFHADGTVLILDSTTAMYPWELLQDGIGPHTVL